MHAPIRQITSGGLPSAGGGERKRGKGLKRGARSSGPAPAALPGPYFALLSTPLFLSPFPSAVCCRYEGGCNGTYSKPDLSRCKCYVCGRYGHLCCKPTPKVRAHSDLEPSATNQPSTHGGAEGSTSPPLTPSPCSFVHSAFPPPFLLLAHAQQPARVTCYSCGSNDHLGEACPCDFREHLRAERMGDMRRAQSERAAEIERGAAAAAAR